MGSWGHGVIINVSDPEVSPRIIYINHKDS
jgi:hypothetical protein